MTDGQERVKLAKHIAMHGICSRRAAEGKIRAGAVFVNGRQEKDVATRVLPSADRVAVDGKELAAQPPAVRLWRFHKPKGCLTSASDPEGRETIYSYLPKEMKNLLYVGRLDYNTEGLLLLTNSGALADHMTSPETGLKRVYRVRAFGRADARRMEQLRRGATIDGMRYRPVGIEEEERENASQRWLTLTLSEGKNREIRVLMEHCGLQVTRLIRTSYGEFSLGTLPPGKAEEVPGERIAY
jgi:23S rRNA pseudouridine2605 synthase